MKNVVLVGAGEIGINACLAGLSRGYSVTTVIDPQRETAKNTASRLRANKVHGSVDELAPGARDALALVTYTSDGTSATETILTILAMGYHVVTTCEELAYSPDNQLHIEQAARTADRTVITTGANPGFAMDRLPVFFANSSRDVNALHVRRSVDTSQRRQKLIEKTGYGLSAEALDATQLPAGVGHVGMLESAKLIALGLGWHPIETEYDSRPIIGEDSKVLGIEQHVRGTGPKGEELHLELFMSWKADSYDRVYVGGTPELTVLIEDGYHGDEGTIAQVTRAFDLLSSLQPGFYGPLDLPL